MSNKAQLRRLEAAFPGKPVQILTSLDNFGGVIKRRVFQAYVAGTAGEDVVENFATGETYHEAVNNLIAANRSTNAGQEAGSTS